MMTVLGFQCLQNIVKLLLASNIQNTQLTLQYSNTTKIKMDSWIDILAFLIATAFANIN